MKNSHKRRICLTSALVVFALAAGHLLCRAQTGQTNRGGSSGGAITVVVFDPVVAKGKGFEITRSQLDERAIRHRADLARIGRVVPPDQATAMDRQVLEGIIQLKLLEARATEADRAKAKQTAEKRFAAEKARATSEESFVRQLKAAGLTAEQLQARLAEAALVETVLERELQVQITDDAVKKFYGENPAMFEQPETVRLAHVLFLTRDGTGAELPDEQKQRKRKIAEEVLKLARAGEDFAKLAREHSEDIPTKDRGGELPPIARGTTLQWLPEVEAAAFALPTNQVSDIITSRLGYHIIKVLEKIPARMPELDKVADVIQQMLRAREFQKLVPPFLEKLKQENEVEILDPALKAVRPLAPPSLARAVEQS